MNLAVDASVFVAAARTEEAHYLASRQFLQQVQEQSADFGAASRICFSTSVLSCWEQAILSGQSGWGAYSYPVHWERARGNKACSSE